MLRNTNDLTDYAIRASDGDIGHVKDFYFDDQSWAIRYLIVDTGSWLSGRKVLISPISIKHPNWAEKVLPVSITKTQVKNSPDVDTEKPVSRQYEMDYLGYFGYPAYWGGTALWGGDGYPGMMLTGVGYGGVDSEKRELRDARIHALTRTESDDPHLRSGKVVIGYRIHATDGEVGHVQSMLVDEESWAIRFLVIDTSNWWLGHQILIATDSIEAVSWSDSTVTVNLSRQTLKDSPVYDSSLPLSGVQEANVYKQHAEQRGARI